MSARYKRRVVMWGGLLAGLGLGSCLAWSLNIFEIAHPQVNDGEVFAAGYPNMAVTVFAVLIFSCAFGAGLGLVSSALIRDEDVRQSGAATASDPAGASSPAAKPSARTILGFVRED